MNSPFQSALLDFIAAEREYQQAHATWKESAAQGLAQAGDVLERELRSMMRDAAIQTAVNLKG